MFACFRDVYRSVRKGMGFKGKTYHDVKASHPELRQNEEQSIAQSVESAVAAPVDHSDYEGITSAAADSTDAQESVPEPNPSTEPVRTIFEDHRTPHQADSEDEDGGAPAVSVVIDEDEGPSATIGSGQNTTATESEESMPNIPYQDHNYDVGRPAVRTNTSRAYFGDNNEPFPYELLQASLDFLERPHLFQLATANDRIDSMIDYEFKTGSPYLILEKAELCYGFFPYEWGIKRKDKEFEYDSIPEMAVELQNSTFLRFKSARFFFQEHEINPLSIMKPISHTWKGGEVYISAQGPILSPDEFARTIATCKLLKMDSINALPILREILKADGCEQISVDLLSKTPSERDVPLELITDFLLKLNSSTNSDRRSLWIGSHGLPPRQLCERFVETVKERFVAADTAFPRFNFTWKYCVGEGWLYNGFYARNKQTKQTLCLTVNRWSFKLSVIQ